MEDTMGWKFWAITALVVIIVIGLAVLGYHLDPNSGGDVSCVSIGSNPCIPVSK
jgi:hypothetical protein